MSPSGLCKHLQKDFPSCFNAALARPSGTLGTRQGWTMCPSPRLTGMVEVQGKQALPTVICGRWTIPPHGPAQPATWAVGVCWLPQRSWVMSSLIRPLHCCWRGAVPQEEFLWVTWHLVAVPVGPHSASGRWSSPASLHSRWLCAQHYHLHSSSC